MVLRIAVAVHDPPVWSLPPEEVTRIARALPEDKVIDARTPAERTAAFPDADVIVATRLSREEARGARRLRWVQSTAVGVTPVLVPEIVESDVVVTNARGVHAEFIAEHAIALALAVRRNLHVAAECQRRGHWGQEQIQRFHQPPIGNSRFVVIGLGEIGRRVASAAAALGFKVTAIRRRTSLPLPDGVECVAGPVELLDILPAADVVVLAAPTTGETRAMIGRRELGVMRPTSVLVNVARGRLVDEDALVEALETQRIGGAGLDAFVREPLPDGHRLWGLPNVLISPHTAAFGGDYWAPAVDLFLDNVDRFRRGAPLRNIVDKLHGY